ncbi:MAG: flavin reductase family protein [Pseudomonadota bacterium]
MKQDNETDETPVETTRDSAVDIHRPLKNAFSRFATGITVATCRTRDGASVAITVNSFTSVSLEPPLVLWCLETKARTYDHFMAADSYGICVLRADQRALSDRFAGYPAPGSTPPPMRDGPTGAPLLEDCLAWFDCRIVDRHPAGDHVILIAEVVDFHSEPGPPLVYFASKYVEGLGDKETSS